MTNSQPKKMTNSQRILKYFQKNMGEVSNEELSRETKIDKSNIPREVKKLEKKGYVITKRYERIGRAKYVWFNLTNSQPKKTNSQPKNTTISQNKPKKISNIINKKDLIPIYSKSAPISKKSEETTINYTYGMVKEVKKFGKTIPLDKLQETTHWVLDKIDQLYKGVYYYLNAWQKRYKKRLKKTPNSPVIPEYEKMQKTLEEIKELKKLKEEIELAKVKQ